jgi:hypothetical protein
LSKEQSFPLLADPDFASQDTGPFHTGDLSGYTAPDPFAEFNHMPSSVDSAI